MARLQGFRDALAVAGLDSSLSEPGEFSEEGGTVAMGRLLERAPDLDAVFIASDQMAIGALRTLASAGRTVPGDVAIIGFNDIPAARHTAPPLTTVNQPIEALGREMARMLLALIAGNHPSPLILPTRLIRRDSA
jgi:DNA-binding LacI/PurR family transcriptional regulator